MATPIDPKRLPALKAALAKYKPDDWAAQRELGALYGVAPSRFATLIKARFSDFPAYERRGDKINWYPARAAVQSMISYMEGSSAKHKAAAARHSAVMGRAVEQTKAKAKIEVPQPEATPLSAAELDRLASAQTRIWKLKREQGLFVPRSEVEDLARRYHSTIAREVMNIPQRLDPNGMLAPLERAQLTRICRDIALELHEIMGGMLADADERSDGTVGARAGVDPNKQRRGTRQRSGDLSRAA